MCTTKFLLSNLRHFQNYSSCTRELILRNNVTVRLFSASSYRRLPIEEFFDEKSNWGLNKTVRVGRSWLLDELRIKSNEDLHKLWFVLLKEKNMLLTMEEEYKRNLQHMPNPERIDKVEISMENLESVVRERNRAYFELETGKTGERDRYLRMTSLGEIKGYKPVEHAIPKWMNTSYRRRVKLRYFHSYQGVPLDYLRLFDEKRRSKNYARCVQNVLEVAGIFERFENVDIEALQKLYPSVDVKKIRTWNRSRGPHLNNMA